MNEPPHIDPAERTPSWEKVDVVLNSEDGKQQIRLSGFAGAWPWWDHFGPPSFKCLFEGIDGDRRFSNELGIEDAQPEALAAFFSGLSSLREGGTLFWESGDQSSEVRLNANGYDDIEICLVIEKWIGIRESFFGPTSELIDAIRNDPEAFSLPGDLKPDIIHGLESMQEIVERSSREFVEETRVRLSRESAKRTAGDALRLLLVDSSAESLRRGRITVEVLPKGETLDSRLVGQAIEDAQRRWAEGGDNGLAIEEIIKEILVPAYNLGGLRAIEGLIKERLSVPGLAACLLELTAEIDLDPLAIFTRDEVVDSAVAYLSSDFSDAHHWAWSFFWHYAEDLDSEEHLRLLLDLIEKAPDNDDALWMIGDGPLGELEMRPGMCERLEMIKASNTRLARIRQLVIDDLEHWSH